MSVIYSVLGAIVVVYLLDAYFCRKKHPQEPEYIRPTVPLIGHALGMVQYGSKYYELLSPGRGEMFTLPIFSFRLYIVNSRHLFPVIMRNARSLSFQPFTKIASGVWADASHEFMEMHNESHPFIKDLFKDTRTALSPGHSLDYQNHMTGESLQRSIEKLNEQAGSSGLEDFELYGWIHHVVGLATSDGVFGKRNPFRNEKTEQDFWTWMAAIKKMTIKLPRVLMSKDIQARDRFFAAFEEYARSDYADAADVIKIRKRLYDRDGVSLPDQAGHLASFNIALLGNTVPTAFWALYDVISRPALMADIRAEVESSVVTREQDKISLDVAALRTSCPLLLSSYQESQRTRSIHANIRQALSDTMVESPTTGSKYFLAKGNYVQMPSGPIHKDENIWGPTAKTFDPYRFVNDNAATRKGESYAFMPWGSAPHMCPARQFASTEIMLFIALMIMRFDFAPANGVWSQPRTMTGELTTIMPPNKDILLNIKKRVGWQGPWNLEFGESSKRVPLASG